MKKQLSVVMLIVRSSIWKVLLIFAAMVVSQVVLFFAMGAGEEAYLLDALNRIPSFVVVLIGLHMVSPSLALPLCDRGGRMNNLILRLGVSEKRIFWMQVLFNAVVYWLFIMVQGLTMLLLCGIYEWVTPGNLDPMAIFVASYQHPLFHRFLPLHDVLEWINHIILIGGLSICVAAYPIRQRHKRTSICTFIMLVFAASQYCDMDASVHLEAAKLVLSIMVTLCVAIISLSGVLTLEVDDYGKA